ncbi:hypothetical protein ACHAPJ_013434, partial [Fusarium lateritium]
MGSKWRVVDGQRLTLTDVNPPKGWTNHYDVLGGDEFWAEMDRDYPFEMQPLFGMKDTQDGMKWVMIQAGDGNGFWVYDFIETDMHKIKIPSDLESIVATINDENQGVY